MIDDSNETIEPIIQEGFPMKKIVKDLTVIILLTASFASSAQKFILIDYIEPLLANNSVVQNEIVLSSEFTVSGTLMYVEEKLGLEDWMLVNWLKAALSEELYTSLAQSTETDLLLEDWMLSSFSSKPNNDWDFLKVETESALELEDWMICTDSWCVRK